MVKAALLGRDIGYTKSPQVHKAIADIVGVELSFDVVDVTYDKLDGAVDKLIREYDGFFITKPYKNEVKKYLGEVKTECGVNFVTCINRTGYNTDGKGFMRAIDLTYPEWRGEVNAVLVLGAGGAAYAVTEELKKAGKTVYILNRTMMNAAKLCATLGAELYLNQPTEMIVNCTTLGLNGEDALYGLCVVPQFAYAYDLIYSHETAFLRRCGHSGAKTLNGKDMLILQAIEGDKILFDKIFETKEVFEKVSKLLGEEK